MLNSDIRDRLAAAQAFHGEVAQTLSDLAQGLSKSGRDQENDGEGFCALTDFLRRRAEGARDGE